jgi:hypothetical protein
MNVSILAGFLDELDGIDKVAVSRVATSFPQGRRGIRSLRVHNLIGRDFVKEDSPGISSEPDHHNPEDQTVANPEMADSSDGGDGGGEMSIGKMAAVFTEERKEKAIGAFVKARPYVAGGLKAGIPAALAGKIIAGEGPRGSNVARVAGIIGAGLGVANEGLKNWAEKNKRKAVAKQLLKD